MIICPRCGKENQDHYKFCLGCGAELPREAVQPKRFTAPTPPSGIPAVSASAGSSSGAGPSASVEGTASADLGTAPTQASPQFGGAAAQSADRTSDGSTSCPQCGASVPANFKFCGSCGYDMAAVRGSAPAPASAPASAPAPAPTGSGGRGQLVLIRPDGTEGDSFSLGDNTIVGREAGGPFANDTYLSPRHAEIQVKGSQAAIKDLGSLNGVYYRIEREVPIELPQGSIFRVGQELILFESLPEVASRTDGVEMMGSPNPGFLGRVRLVIGRETYGNSYCIPPTGMHLGRERGDIIFPDDGYVSGIHCRIHGDGKKVFLTDVGSSNGTFLRIRDEVQLKTGSLMLLGQQLFRIEY